METSANVRLFLASQPPVTHSHSSPAPHGGNLQQSLLNSPFHPPGIPTAAGTYTPIRQVPIGSSRPESGSIGHTDLPHRFSRSRYSNNWRAGAGPHRIGQSAEPIQEPDMASCMDAFPLFYRNIILTSQQGIAILTSLLTRSDHSPSKAHPSGSPFLRLAATPSKPVPSSASKRSALAPVRIRIALLSSLSSAVLTATITTTLCFPTSPAATLS